MNSGWPSSTTSTARLPRQNFTHSSGTNGYVTLSRYKGILLVPKASAQSSNSSARKRVVIEAALQHDAEVTGVGACFHSVLAPTPSMISLSFCSAMNRSAAGNRTSIFSRSCA